MIIGVDADGVLTDMQEFNYQCGKKFFRKEIVNPTGYSVKEIFKVSKIAEFCCGLKYFPKYCKEYPPRPDTAEILGKLKAEGHVLHEITARKFVTSNFPWGKLSRKWFLNWCEQYGIKFDSVTFCSEKYGPKEKCAACKRLKVDVMVDDRPEIVMHLAENGVKVLMIDAPYNQKVQHANVTRVYGWKDVYEKLCAL